MRRILLLLLEFVALSAPLTWLWLEWGQALYVELLEAVEGRSVLLEEYARSMILQEERDLGEVDKMLREPGEVAPFGDR